MQNIILQLINLIDRNHASEISLALDFPFVHNFHWGNVGKPY